MEDLSFADEHSSFRDRLKSLGVKTVVTVVARRAAGVWTHIPSLAIQNLTDLEGSAKVLLLDFGLRNEMLEHFKIDYTKCDQQFSFLGICNHLGGPNSIKVLDYYRNIIDERLRCVQTTAMDLGEPYKEFLKTMSNGNKDLYLCPYSTGDGFNLDQTELSLSTFRDGLEAIISSVKTDILYITFEGQPELPLFQERLSRNSVMRFCLDISDKIVGMVRTDSLIRLDESIEIPQYLASFPVWESKLCLILTRHPMDVVMDDKYRDIVIGYLPMFDLIAQSVQDTGAIPIVDLRIEKYSFSDNQLSVVNYYLGNMQGISRYILSVKGDETFAQNPR